MREDFRRNPAKALAKRMIWRLRWVANSSPIDLQHAAGFSIAAPKGAAGALIYYLGRSEPETCEFMSRFLKSGMVFFDIGAHIGEYTVLAGSRVGEAGQVHAFEAQATTVALLRGNCEKNRLRNAVINSCAVSNVEGSVEFAICSEPSMSSIVVDSTHSGGHAETVRVASVTLDAYCERHRVWPDLVKIDVEGAEWLVLQGAVQTLSRTPPACPALLLECLEDTYARFDVSPGMVITFLEELGYKLFEICRNGKLAPHQAGIRNSKGYNLVALKS